MNSNEKCRVELISSRRIKRMPGLHAGASKKEIVKVKDFTKKRGYCSPVLLSDSGGCMTLLSGEAVFEAGLEGKAKIPAVIVQTDGEADDLMFALQSSELNETLNAIAASAAIVRLIDSHNVTRKDIAEALGKSSTWLNRMESLCRKLNSEVQVLVAQGHISPRSAQEIARLPKDVQMKFAVSVSNNFLNKESVAYLVNRYLNEDTGTEERERIIKSPELALPIETKYRGKPGRDKSVSARLSLAIARCLDGNTYLANVLDNIDIGVVAVRISDIKALSESLMALHAKLLVIFPPGGNESGDSND